jgi:hypothetical protein
VFQIWGSGLRVQVCGQGVCDSGSRVDFFLDSGSRVDFFLDSGSRVDFFLDSGSRVDFFLDSGCVDMKNSSVGSVLFEI